VATLQEYLHDPTLRYEDSYLFRYFTRFQPRTLQEALLMHREEPLHPDRFDGGQIKGHFLIRGGNFSFLFHEGQYRAAALKALGVCNVPVVLWEGFSAIDFDQLSRWTEKGGLYSAYVAELMFDKLLVETGFPKADQLGLLG
jgi:hypothetical protein